MLLSALASASTPTGPLIVDNNSHIVVMEYEAWFGPNAVTFQGTAAKPLLQSADMQSLGGGYDSADPRIIRQHVAKGKNKSGGDSRLGCPGRSEAPPALHYRRDRSEQASPAHSTGSSPRPPR